ncbi:hypothetical protein CISIN_1g0027172mg, partial [Citrus sinensis]
MTTPLVHGNSYNAIPSMVVFR